MHRMVSNLVHELCGFHGIKMRYTLHPAKSCRISNSQRIEVHWGQRSEPEWGSNQKGLGFSLCAVSCWLVIPKFWTWFRGKLRLNMSQTHLASTFKLIHGNTHGFLTHNLPLQVTPCTQPLRCHTTSDVLGLRGDPIIGLTRHYFVSV
jgi:hypothetical protein